MAAVLHALQGILTIVIMIATGFCLSRRGWFSESFSSAVAQLVTKICLPTYMIVNLTVHFSRDQLLEMSRGLAVPIISMVLGYFIGHAVAKLLKVRRERVGVFCTVFFVSNTIFIGLPMTLALFGEAGVPYVMLYYMVNTTMFWVFAVHDMASDAGTAAPWFSRQTLKIVLNPPLLGFMTGIFLVLMDWRLPLPIEAAFKYLGSMTTPLAMLFIGIAISKASWDEISFDKELVAAMLGRFVICPLCVLALLPFFNLPILMSEVFVMQAAMPAMTNTAIVSKMYGGDYKYAAVLTIVSTLLSILTTPFYMWVLRG